MFRFRWSVLLDTCLPVFGSAPLRHCKCKENAQWQHYKGEALEQHTREERSVLPSEGAPGDGRTAPRQEPCVLRKSQWKDKRCTLPDAGATLKDGGEALAEALLREMDKADEFENENR